MKTRIVWRLITVLFDIKRTAKVCAYKVNNVHNDFFLIKHLQLNIF